MKLVVEVITETGHRLNRYKGKCKNLHGHSWRWVIELEGEVNPKTGMVVDFGEVKKLVEKEFDHKFLFHRKDKLFNFVLDIENMESVGLKPMPFNPTSENLAHYTATKILERFKEVRRVKIDLWETKNNKVSVEVSKG